MKAISPAIPVVVADADLQRVLALYEDGLYCQSYEQASALGPLKDWTGAAARIFAGRLAGNLNAPRLAAWHHHKAWRAEPDHPDAHWYYAHGLLNRRGPWAAWRFLQSHPLPGRATDGQRSHSLALHAAVLGRLRDFDAAEQWLAKAEALGERPWICLERAAVMTFQDRHEEAEEAARRALALRPWYRPALQWVAHFLVQRERDDEAVDLLTQASQRLESAAVFMQLATLKHEQQRYGEVGPLLDAAERLSPLAEKEFTQWLHMRRADLAYFRGDLEQARELSLKADTAFAKRLAERLAERLAHPPAERRRVMLPVPFVRQHYQTCAPATLAALCRYWNMPGDHLEMAAAITYAGTPHHSERHWADTSGWQTKEFTVTWDSVRALLDRGVPFTLTTSELASAHLQGVMGYDDVLGILLIRDPMERHHVQGDADALFDRYRSTGPRGMALAPSAEAERLRGLSLPDDALYDHLHRLERALQQHHRDEAEAACAALEAAAPEHRLTPFARRILASYDADHAEVLKWTNRLLELYPDDLWLLSGKAACLRDLARREERLELLRQMAERKETDPSCWQQYARELSLDARQHDRARYLLRRTIRCLPQHYAAYDALAQLAWNERRFDLALELYRFAFCLEDKDERLACTFFQRARAVGRTALVLGLLERRFARFGKQSAQPARTLAWAYQQLERTTEAVATLRQALELRPDDGELRLHLADMRAQHGEPAEAEAMLQQAQGQAPTGSWLRTAAVLAQHAGDLDRCRDLWRQVVEREPLAEDAQRAYAQRLAESEGLPAALAYLDQLTVRFPHHLGLSRLHIDWLRGEGPAATEQGVRRVLDNHPSDAWARRELALTLADQRKFDEALAELDHAAQLEPRAVAHFSCLARVHSLAGRNAEAREACRQAIELSVDFEIAIHDYVRACDTLEERRAALRFVEEQLIRQVTFGEGLLGFRDAAAYTLPAEELLATLRRGLEARPDLWHAWAAVIRQLLGMNQLDEAVELARQAIERFPHLPVLRLDLASIHRARQDIDAEIASLNDALRIAPGWSIALRQLADAYVRQNRPQQAEALLERALALAPLVNENYPALAELLWKRDAKEEALGKLAHALRLEPGNETAWSRYCEWSAKEQRGHEAVAFARELTSKRPGEARSWIRLAQALGRQGRRPDIEDERRRIEECLAAFDEASRRNPHLGDIHDQKADLLAQLGRFAEARAACRPAVWGEQPPLQLRARAAWIDLREGRFDESIANFRAVLAEDRNYYWAWLQLAETLHAVGRLTDYRDAAEELVRLAPHTAEALSYRGDARMRLGDREGALTDLRAALTYNPGHLFSGMLLIDEHLAKDELDAAQTAIASLEQHAGAEPVASRRVRLLAKQKREGDAMIALDALCRRASVDIWSLEGACRAVAEAGWNEGLDRLLGEAARAEVHHPQVPVLWAQRWRPDADRDLDDRLQALRQAIAQGLHPLQPLDLEAELLARAGRFDEALAVCMATEPTDVVTPLRGRAAWIHWLRGDAAQAIYAMDAVVADDPRYYWGWSQLAEWRLQQGNREEHLAAAEQLVVVAANDPFAWFHRGLAHRNLEDLEAAAADFRQALEVAPGYTLAAFQLFDVLMLREDYSAADKVLERVKQYSDPADYHLRRIDLAVARREKSAIADQVQELCKHTEKRHWILQDAVQRLVQANHGEHALGALEKNLEAGPHVCDVWVRTFYQVHGWKVREKIEKMHGKGSAKGDCAASFAQLLGGMRQTGMLQQWAADHRTLLSKNTRRWGMVGSAFYQAEDDRGVVDWLQDLPEHPDAEPWMLINLAGSLRCLGDNVQAAAVNRWAVEQLKPDHTTSWHEAWLLFDAALSQPTEAVEAEVRRLRLCQLDDYHRLIVGFAEAQAIAASGCDFALAWARRALAVAVSASRPVVGDAALLSAYHTTINAMAQKGGGILARLWALFRRLVPLLPPDARKQGQ